ncbi:uncharacterized protein LOC142202939 [Leptodactylus fuscus]|uniref:uncharacterized protein LOC142202939 n=1 Tax=Leptodactylus fuscus TaxID=238119 RepID=UPI003F4EBC0C
MAGPFAEPPLPELKVSPLGVVPKKEPNKFRMIHHLSFPEGSSVNDGIDPELCSVVYTSFDAAIAWVRKYGKGALLAKTDVEAAFRLLPVHPDIIDTVAMECRLPEDKLLDLRATVNRACHLKKLQLRELQSVLGMLNFALGSFSTIGARSGRDRDELAGRIVAAAGRALNGLVRSSLVESTWVAYEAAWRAWEDWLGFLGEDWEDLEGALLLWIGHCRESGWLVSRMNRLMAGLAFGFKRRGMGDLTKGFLVRQALTGWRRGGSSLDTRRPVSFQLLCDIGGVLQGICTTEAEVSLFKAAFSLAFFGALRIGELVSSSKVRPRGLGFEDIDIYEDRVEFRIRRSKTDRFGRGSVVRLFAISGCLMCPVASVSGYVEGRGRVPGPLLIHADGSYLSRFQFVSVFRLCLQSLGLTGSDYSGHSFRIGAATEAARRGLGEDIVRRIGRWESRRFQLYVRPHLV